MLGVGFRQGCKSPWKLITSSVISLVFVLITQFTLTLIPRYMNSLPLLAKLPLSALLLVSITGLSRGCRRLLRVSGSAPAFVFFNILFIWTVHLTVIRKANPLSWSILINIQWALLLIGFCRILSSDPGFVTYEDSSLTQLMDDDAVFKEEGVTEADLYLEQPVVRMEENSFLFRRVRYCKSCKAHVKGFDHHCPAFGNCIGQKNHILFMVLLIGFIMAEASYIVCSDQFIKRSLIADKAMLENSLSGNLAISTTLFSLLQVMWQVLFLIWHIYCICFNIKTDEWVKWKKYPEFQIPVQPQPGRSFLETQFVNPYDKGVAGNIKHFLSPKE